VRLAIPWQALVWLVTGDTQYREDAKRWMARRSAPSSKGRSVDGTRAFHETATSRSAPEDI
jgi:hypothetical protein